MRKNSVWRRVIGFFGGLVLRALYLTLRVRVSGTVPPGGVLICFWHGEQLCLYGGLPSGKVVAPVSLSKDGELQVGVLSSFGVGAIRGSSSSGGLKLLRALIRCVQSQCRVLFALDGPRGPYRVPKLGAFYLSNKMSVPIVPVVATCSNTYILHETWDKMRIPLPFAKVHVEFGKPMLPDAFSGPEAMRESFIVAIRQLSSDNESMGPSLL